MASKALKELRPNKRNPRLPWTDSQREAFQKSLKEFGDLSGVFYNIKTKQLGGGHKRVEEFNADAEAKLVIAERLAKPDATGTVAWGYVETNGTRFSYREVNWPKAKELAANLAANEHGAEFDWQGVSELLKSLDGSFDLTLTGFPAHELENLMKAEWKMPEVEEMPGHHGGKIDPIHLTVDARTALDAAKAKLGESDDVTAILKLCEHYTVGVSS